jgi:hypothetical protein
MSPYAWICIAYALIGSVLTVLSSKALARFRRPPQPQAQMCSRIAPHICTINGPCNGWPRKRTLLRTHKISCGCIEKVYSDGATENVYYHLDPKEKL